MQFLRDRRILPVLIAIVSAIYLFRSPYSASNCEVIPETGEYAIGAQRLATLGRYDLEIDRVSYPPRYPPWLSLMMTPLYWLRPQEIGMGILLVLAFAVGTVLCAFEIGRRLSNDWGGVFAALLVLHNPVFTWDARQIVPDVPALTLSLVCCWIFLRVRERSATWRLFLVAGACGGLAGAMRTLNYATIIPLLFLTGCLSLAEAANSARRIVALLLPPLGFIIATLIYDQIRFGSPLRTGYEFWAPIPHQFFHLLFAPRYLVPNLKALAPWWWLAIGGAIALVILWRQRPQAARSIGWFILLAAAPISAIHLFYFWGDPRFHLLMLAMLCIVLGAGIGMLVECSLRRREWLIPLIIVASAAIPIHPSTPEPIRREIADDLRAGTPDDAIIVTAVDPVYLEPFLLRGTHRRIIPISRWVEYAAQAIAPKPLRPMTPPPTNPVKPRIPQAFAAGAKDVVPFTADENPDQILAWAAQGKPVYIELRIFPEDPKLREFAGPLAQVLKQLPRGIGSRVASPAAKCKSVLMKS
jgi:hypothetical protein